MGLNLYPQVSDNGTPIPDAIGNPRGCIYGPVAQNGEVSLELGDTENTCTFYTTDAMVLILHPTKVPAAGSFQSDCYTLLPGVMYTIFVEKSSFRLKHIGAEANPQYFINVQTPWAGAGAQVETRYR